MDWFWNLLNLISFAIALYAWWQAENAQGLIRRVYAQENLQQASFILSELCVLMEQLHETKTGSKYRVETKQKCDARLLDCLKLPGWSPDQIVLLESAKRNIQQLVIADYGSKALVSDVSIDIMELVRSVIRTKQETFQ